MVVAPTARTRVFAVLGDPVTQSRSPVLHNGWMADHGIDGVYVALTIPERGAKAFFEALPFAGLAGANVTTPHKDLALASAHEVDLLAKAARAANTLTITDQLVQAANTDALAVADACQIVAPGFMAQARQALVLGAGGAARAAAIGLRARGHRVQIANRTDSKAQLLASELDLQFLPWQELAAGFAGADLIANCTSASRQEGVDWPFAAARAQTLAFDAVYVPRETPFLLAAQAHGLVPVDGVWMLVLQAAAAFEIWHGVRPDVALGRARVLADMERAR